MSCPHCDGAPIPGLSLCSSCGAAVPRDVAERVRIEVTDLSVERAIPLVSALATLGQLPEPLVGDVVRRGAFAISGLLDRSQRSVVGLMLDGVGANHVEGPVQTEDGFALSFSVSAPIVVKAVLAGGALGFAAYVGSTWGVVAGATAATVVALRVPRMLPTRFEVAPTAAHLILPVPPVVADRAAKLHHRDPSPETRGMLARLADIFQATRGRGQILTSKAAAAADKRVQSLALGLCDRWESETPAARRALVEKLEALVDRLPRATAQPHASDRLVSELQAIVTSLG